MAGRKAPSIVAHKAAGLPEAKGSFQGQWYAPTGPPRSLKEGFGMLLPLVGHVYRLLQVVGTVLGS